MRLFIFTHLYIFLSTASVKMFGWIIMESLQSVAIISMISWLNLDDIVFKTPAMATIFNTCQAPWKLVIIIAMATFSVSEYKNIMEAARVKHSNHLSPLPFD